MLQTHSPWVKQVFLILKLQFEKYFIITLRAKFFCFSCWSKTHLADKVSPFSKEKNVQAANTLTHGQQRSFSLQGLSSVDNPAKIDRSAQHSISEPVLTTRAHWGPDAVNDSVTDMDGTLAYEVAALTYEKGLLNDRGREIHGLNQALLGSAFSLVRDSVAKATPEELSTIALATLSELLDSGELNLTCYREREQDAFGYGKYLLYNSSSTQKPFCLQLFAFKPGQETQIHDHPCECMSLVVKGTLEEEMYDAKDAKLGGLLHSSRRGTGSTGSFFEGQFGMAHRLSNNRFVDVRLWPTALNARPVSVSLKAAPVAISVHLYQGMDGALLESLAVTAKRGELAGVRKAVAAVSRVYASI
jgi:hypothetical protein